MFHKLVEWLMEGVLFVCLIFLFIILPVAGLYGIYSFGYQDGKRDYQIIENQNYNYLLLKQEQERKRKEFQWP